MTVTDNKTNGKKMADAVPNNAAIPRETIKELAKKAISELGPEVSKEEKVTLGKLFMKIFAEGQTPREAMNMPDSQVSAMYSFAYSLFTSGKYPEARTLFSMLSLFDPGDPNFSIALGVCQHRLKDYKAAAASYMQSAVFDADNPLPYFYAYDCFYQLKEPLSALIMLNTTIEKCKDPKYGLLKVKAETLLTALQNEMTEKK